MRSFVAVLAITAILGALVTGCAKEEKPPKQEPPSLTPGTVQGETPTSVAGIAWTVPSRWAAHPPRQMRLATYMIPAADGDSEGGECAVFHFGGGQGGDVQANIDRWLGQFENTGKPVQETREVNGLPVTTVEVSGTYLSPGGPRMQSQGKKENYRLLGAIIGAPGGSVFFKLTGPAKTVAFVEEEFEELIASVKKL
jgi:hypothetical protein